MPGGKTTTREVLQIGAELFGEPGIEGDREVVGLLLSSLAAAGVPALHLDLGHVGVYRALAAGAGIAGTREDTALFQALRSKDLPAVVELTAKFPAAWRDALNALPTLYGPANEVIAAARDRSSRHAGDRQCTGRDRRAGAIRPNSASTRCTSISPTSADIITRTARSSRSSPRAKPSRSAMADATTASAGFRPRAARHRIHARPSSTRGGARTRRRQRPARTLIMCRIARVDAGIRANDLDSRSSSLTLSRRPRRRRAANRR